MQARYGKYGIVSLYGHVPVSVASCYSFKYASPADRYTLDNIAATPPLSFRSPAPGSMGGTLASAAGGGSRARIYGPRNLEDEFHIVTLKDEIAQVLAKIEKIYSRVKLDKDYLLDNNGLCFGLLDPATNIIVNSAISAAFATPRAEGRRRGEQAAGDMSQRSLDGLVAFLTYLFPYLPDAEARRYLDAAKADPLVASLIIVNRRGMRRFGFCSGTTVAAVETALRCAAAAAGHPDPQQLVMGWKLLLSPGLKNFVSELSRTSPDHAAVLCILTKLRVSETSGQDLQLEQSWELASSRRTVSRMPKTLPPVRAAIKRQLLATIHGFYLQVLARLPAAELRTRYHRSMLMGGYCYGPLDPVSNIIVNTIWYEQTFPTSKQVTLHMISTESLWRIAARSLYGLVSFLCTRYPGLEPDLAMQRLQAAGVDLQVADPNLFGMPNAMRRDNMLSWSGCCCAQVGLNYRRSVEGTCPSTCVAEAYAAAATAAFHTNPPVQQEFFESPDTLPKLKVASELLQDGCLLSSKDLEFLSELLLKCHASSDGKSHQQQEPAPVKLTKSHFSYVSQCDGRFWSLHERVSNKVKAALDTYNKNRVPQYRLHVICGVNELVSGPEFCPDDEEVVDYNPWTPHKYHHSHINFLVTCEGSQCEGAPAMLFFAECSNHGTDNWCVPISPPHPDAEQVRCIYCEHEGNRIVHPAMIRFHGHDIEFEKVLRGEPLFPGSGKEKYNNWIIRNKIREVVWVYDLGDDCIYSINYADEDDGDEDFLSDIDIW